MEITWHSDIDEELKTIYLEEVGEYLTGIAGENNILWQNSNRMTAQQYSNILDRISDSSKLGLEWIKLEINIV